MSVVWAVGSTLEVHPTTNLLAASLVSNHASAHSASNLQIITTGLDAMAAFDIHPGWLLLIALVLKGTVFLFSLRATQAKAAKVSKPSASKYSIVKFATKDPAARKVVVIGGASFHGRWVLLQNSLQLLHLQRSRIRVLSARSRY